MGRNVELAPTPGVIRDFTFGNYIVRYALHTEAVAILRVWHHYENRE
jgi:plasmid stabilization system protein ParE